MRGRTYSARTHKRQICGGARLTKKVRIQCSYWLVSAMQQSLLDIHVPLFPKASRLDCDVSSSCRKGSSHDVVYTFIRIGS